MKLQTQLERKALPNLTEKQQISPSFLQIIKSKKIQLSKKLQALQVSEINLPHISLQHEQNILTIETETNNELKEHEQYIENSVRTPQASGIYKFKNILDQLSDLQKRKPSQNGSMKYRSSQKQSINETKMSRIMTKTIQKMKKSKTQTQQRSSIQPIKSNRLSSNRKLENKEQVLIKINQQIANFFQSIDKVPNNMKLRNEENLTATVSYLQNFNPFFNRNPRIVNICLLKMGKIILKPSSAMLYRSGEQIHHFYIILHGRVKLVEGAFRRVCQTGETILQQVLFADKVKKTSLQRAKTLCSTYLLGFKIEEYKKLKQELISHGLKLGCQQMQTIVKRNFIVKNWMRNKKKHQGNY